MFGLKRDPEQHKSKNHSKRIRRLLTAGKTWFWANVIKLRRKQKIIVILNAVKTAKQLRSKSLTYRHCTCFTADFVLHMDG
ncbi:hypothetical protein DU508_11365 [Pedobacter chinensis]|uniref:Uncharacterized protein n=1 Tax=Pedobacter chinensis TaxID=2282421 RepID=A0A369PVA3_9SPHI|nr:hypothetical protein DU508_11365 [Pedobacter chinensis]